MHISILRLVKIILSHACLGAVPRLICRLGPLSQLSSVLLPLANRRFHQHMGGANDITQMQSRKKPVWNRVFGAVRSLRLFAHVLAYLLETLSDMSIYHYSTAWVTENRERNRIGSLWSSTYSGFLSSWYSLLLQWPNFPRDHEKCRWFLSKKFIFAHTHKHPNLTHETYSRPDFWVSPCFTRRH